MEKGFFENVYQVVRQIPRGYVTTYGMIAKWIGRPTAARHVGFAMHSAPEGLPCHRVVNQRGEMAPRDVFGTEDFQRHLLMEEGITFLPNGRIDMKKHLWGGTLKASRCSG